MPKLQSIAPNNKIKNHSVLGRNLKKLFESNVFKVLKKYDCGWSDGGCQILAHALKKWADTIGLKGYVEYIVLDCKGDAFTDHVIFVVSDEAAPTELVIDGEGLTTRDLILSRWHKTERYDEPFTALSLSTEGPCLEDIPFDSGLSSVVANELLRILGHKEKVLEQLHKVRV